MLLLSHRGRSVFSHLSPCAFRVLSFLPSAVISSSLAAEGGGRENTHRGRWLIFRSTCAQGWENSAAAASSSSSSSSSFSFSSPCHLTGRKPHHGYPAPLCKLCGWGSAAGGVKGGLYHGSWTYTPLSSKAGAAHAGTPPTDCREGAAAARWSPGDPLPWQLVGGMAEA